MQLWFYELQMTARVCPHNHSGLVQGELSAKACTCPTLLDEMTASKKKKAVLNDTHFRLTSCMNLSREELRDSNLGKLGGWRFLAPFKNDLDGLAQRPNIGSTKI